MKLGFSQFLTILSLIIITSSVFATKNNYYEETPDKYKEVLSPKKSFFDKIEDITKMNIGLAHGPETYLPAVLSPNISFDFNFNSNYPKLYLGFNFHIWMIVTLGGHIGAHCGLNFKYVFFELGVSQLFWGAPDDSDAGEKISYATLNPKIGLRLFDLIYIKAGPSFYLGEVSDFAKEQSKDLTYLEIYKSYLNIEIGYTHKF